MLKKVVKFFTDNYIIFCTYALIGWIYEVSWYLIIENTFVNRGVLFGPFLPIYGFGMLILLLVLKKFMTKKHETNNPLYLSITLFTVVTFIYVTIIEYTTPKIYRVDYFLQNYGLGLIIINLIIIILVNLFIKLTKNEKVKKIDTTIVLVFLAIWIITTLIEFVSHYFIETYSHTLLWDYTYDFLNINRRVNWDASRNFAIGGTFFLYTIQPLLDKFLKNAKLNTKIIITLIIGIPMLIDLIINVILK
ncbi:MAG: putative ABC transporter permease [Bacilli bacterium]|nr:putative ABC transporter permease [Bacilli bacterium]